MILSVMFSAKVENVVDIKKRKPFVNMEMIFFPRPTIFEKVCFLP